MPRRIDDLADEVLAASDTGLPERADGLTVREFLATSPGLEEFWTPLTVLDAEALRRNAATIQAWAAAHGMELMPHGKTTMAPALWYMQLEAGATGLTLATPGQVRTARTFGVSSIMLANALVAPGRARVRRGRARRPRLLVRLVGRLDRDRRGDGTRARGIRGLAAPIDRRARRARGAGRTHRRPRRSTRPRRSRGGWPTSPALRLAGVAGYEGSLGHDRSATAMVAVRDYLSDLLELHDGGAADRRPTSSSSRPAAAPISTSSPTCSISRSRRRPRRARTRWVLRSGASLLHDDGFYHGISPLDGNRATAGTAALARDARLRARRVAPRAAASRSSTAASATSRTTRGCPCRSASATALGGERDGRSPGHPSPPSTTSTRSCGRMPRLPVSIGDVVSLGLSHPCTAFDKRRWLPVVEHAGSTRVVDLVRTFF